MTNIGQETPLFRPPTSFLFPSNVEADVEIWHCDSCYQNIFSCVENENERVGNWSRVILCSETFERRTLNTVANNVIIAQLSCYYKMMTINIMRHMVLRVGRITKTSRIAGCQLCDNSTV